MTSANGSRLREIHIVMSEELLSRFDAAAAGHGSRAALLRALMAQAVEEPVLASIAPKGPLKSRLRLRLTDPELLALDRESATMGLSRSGWVSALIRRRISRKPTLDRSDQYCLVAMQADLRRTANNVNQIARRLDEAAASGAVLNPDARYFHDLRTEIRAHMTALRSAIEGNLAYWRVEA